MSLLLAAALIASNTIYPSPATPAPACAYMEVSPGYFTWQRNDGMWIMGTFQHRHLEYLESRTLGDLPLRRYAYTKDGYQVRLEGAFSEGGVLYQSITNNIPTPLIRALERDCAPIQRIESRR